MQYNFTYVNAAVDKEDGEMLMAMSQEGSKSATGVVDKNNIGNASKGISYQVRTINLAGYLRNKLPPSGALAYLKLDVEGLEYSLLPWLLLEGAICRLSHLRIEWHLVAQPIRNRLEGLALRHSIGGLLRHGCTSPPLMIEHEEFAANNFAFPVPGIQELATWHTIWPNSKHGGCPHVHMDRGEAAGGWPTAGSRGMDK